MIENDENKGDNEKEEEEVKKDEGENDTFDLQKVFFNLISSQLVAHTTYLLTTVALTVAIAGIFLTYSGHSFVKIILIFLFSISLSFLLYAYARWKYYTGLFQYSTHRYLVESIKKGKINVRELAKSKKDPSFKNEIIYETLKVLKDKLREDKNAKGWFYQRPKWTIPFNPFEDFSLLKTLIFAVVLCAILTLLYLIFIPFILTLI